MAPVALRRRLCRWVGAWGMLLAALFGVVASTPLEARRRANAQPANAQKPAATSPAEAAPASTPTPASAEAARTSEPPLPSVPTDGAGLAAPPAPSTTAVLRLPITEPPGVAASAPRADTGSGKAGETASHLAAGRDLPPPPQDPTAAKAYAALAGNCASCHQRGAAAGGASATSAAASATSAAAPAAELGNILDLQRLAREPGLVQPGNPDGSRLYQVMYARHAPRDVLKGEGAKGSRDEPSIADVQALRDWIEGLPLAAASSCPDRPRIDAAELDAIMRRWLEVAGADAARSTRFVSLAHLHNACATEGELAAYRQAVQKLLNSLSWAEMPARIETVGDALVVLAFRLSDLGWVPAHWERLANAEPEGGAVPTPEALKTVSGSAHPVIRGDWLAAAATRAPLYYELLGLPDRQADLARLIGVDLEQDVRTNRMARAGLRSGAETRAPRIVERHGGRAGQALWVAHDWPAATSAQDVLDHPQAPHYGASAGGKSAPPADGSRFMLTLPNGLLAFGAHDAAGQRRAAVGGITAGRSCMGCHAAGPLPFTDEVRAHLTGDKFTGPREARDAALFSSPAAGDFARLFEEDGYRYRRALIQAGVDPDLMLDGLEIVTALARAFERPVASERLAAEAGIAVAELAPRIEALPGEAKVLGMRLRQGQLTRRDAERLLAVLKETAPTAGNAEASLRPGAAKDGALATGSVTAPAGDTIELALWSDRTSYAPGDLVTLHAQPSRNCYLTLIDIDAGGKATVLFPNEFEPDNLVAAGTTLRVPGQKSPYQLRLKDKGRETTVAICSTAQKIPAGIDIDYERQRFTALGLWSNYLTEAQALEAEYRRNPDRARAQAAARAHANALALAKGRAAADASAAAARAVAEPASPGPEAEIRTAIQFKVQ